MGKKVNVLNVPVDAVDMEETVERVTAFIRQRGPHIIVTANAEMVMQATRDDELHKILVGADLVLADGIGVVWAARYQGSPLPERVAGADLVNRLLKMAAAQGYKIFFLGAAPGVAEEAAQRVCSLYKNIVLCGTQDGYFTPDTEPAVIAAIKEASPDILLAGLGVPRQEKWLWKHKDLLGVPVCIGVGGVFDVLAGVTRRAPVWMQKSGLEWLYRLVKQPWRIGRMMALPRFVLRVLGGGQVKNC
ncbi:MAG TPA: glycosyltransferase [Firmicutes bacterium]|nr:glycosyltransferase [Bacillota bacterium]HWR56933.1 WecB/TagA/CpsF family glycosyltransferase [Negativicutes bacterium]